MFWLLLFCIFDQSFTILNRISFRLCGKKHANCLPMQRCSYIYANTANFFRRYRILFNNYEQRGAGRQAEHSEIHQKRLQCFVVRWYVLLIHIQSDQKRWKRVALGRQRQWNRKLLRYYTWRMYNVPDIVRSKNCVIKIIYLFFLCCIMLRWAPNKITYS